MNFGIPDSTLFVFIELYVLEDCFQTTGDFVKIIIENCYLLCFKMILSRTRVRIEPMHFPLNYIINWWNQLLVIKMTDEFLLSLSNIIFCRPFFIVQWHFMSIIMILACFFKSSFIIGSVAMVTSGNYQGLCIKLR